MDDICHTPAADNQGNTQWPRHANVPVRAQRIIYTMNSHAGLIQRFHKSQDWLLVTMDFRLARRA